MSTNTILVWFRNDLRIHDNEILWQALARADNIVPVYVVDPRNFIDAETKELKTGVLRAKFILDSVHDLKVSLSERGGDLLITVGYPEEVIPALAEKYKVKEVYHHREVAENETNISTLVEEALWKIKLNLRHFIGHTLYHKEDLPFPIKDIPDAFNVFKKKIERETAIRPAIPAPEKIIVVSDMETSSLPSLESIGYENDLVAGVINATFAGGERQALNQLKLLLTGKETDHHHVFMDDNATYLSPWLSLGCLSVHRLYHEINANAALLPKKLVVNVINGLLWRDYYRFMLKKHGHRFFSENGFSTEQVDRLSDPSEALNRWKNGETGITVLDEAMSHLRNFGFITQRSRILAAHYLVHELGYSHLVGAAYFEVQLLDYNPASNYGNWAHVAGVGSSIKDNKVANLNKLLSQY